MNKGTKIRTALRIVFSVYTAFCMWQVTISELAKQLNAPWVIGLCAVIIVLSGLAVDFLTTYYNNDFTEEACEGTGITRQKKAERKADYEGERYFEDEDDEIEAVEFTEDGDEA